MIRICLADDNQEFCQLLQDYFHSSSEIKIKSVVHNGLEAINVLQEQEIDVLLLDMIMPQLDGFGVLHWLKENLSSNRPKVIVFSAFAKEEVARNAANLGVDYYILKPFDLKTLSQRIIEIANGPTCSVIANRKISNTNLNGDMEREVSTIIQRLKIPPHFKGYAYLREAIILTIQEPNLINEVTKKLYPMIAEHYNTTKHRVERSMRFAIETAWSKGDVQTLHELFGYCVDDKKGKPTNASFIAKISDKIRLERRVKAV